MSAIYLSNSMPRPPSYGSHQAGNASKDAPESPGDEPLSRSYISWDEAEADTADRTQLKTLASQRAMWHRRT
ncbi:uncharacterized [Tachysurus ichikawai]